MGFPAEKKIVAIVDNGDLYSVAYAQHGSISLELQPSRVSSLEVITMPDEPHIVITSSNVVKKIHTSAILFDKKTDSPEELVRQFYKKTNRELLLKKEEVNRFPRKIWNWIPLCNHRVIKFDGYANAQELEHVIEAQRYRYTCSDCGKTIYRNIPNHIG